MKDALRPAPLLEARELRRVLGGEVPQTILDGVSLTVERGDFVALTGASGSGKSTLLYLLGALDRPTSGAIYVDGSEVSALDDDARAAFRNERLGYVFQFHFLLPEFDVLENVALPLRRRGLAPDEAEARAALALSSVGLAAVLRRETHALSGGQQQRVSIARAIANDPAILLADEPTGNLDSRNAALVFDLFAQLAATGHTIIMVTHEPSFAERTGRRVELRDGRLVLDARQHG
jgi:lipoprotein-releasing system ATP-binding protein